VKSMHLFHGDAQGDLGGGQQTEGKNGDVPDITKQIVGHVDNSSDPHGRNSANPEHPGEGDSPHIPSGELGYAKC